MAGAAAGLAAVTRMTRLELRALPVAGKAEVVDGGEHGCPAGCQMRELEPEMPAGLDDEEAPEAG